MFRQVGKVCTCPCCQPPCGGHGNTSLYVLWLMAAPTNIPCVLGCMVPVIVCGPPAIPGGTQSPIYQ